MTEQQAMRMALEALEGFIPYLPIEHDKPQCDRYDKAIIALRQALEQADEPVAEVTSQTGAEITMSWWHEPALPMGTKLYTRPQPAAWVGLTDEDLCQLASKYLQYQIESYEISGIYNFAQAIEAKLKEKNG